MFLGSLDVPCIFDKWRRVMSLSKKMIIHLSHSCKEANNCAALGMWWSIAPISSFSRMNRNRLGVPFY